MAMKKMLLLAMAMFLVGLFFGSVALAQVPHMNGDQVFTTNGGTIIEILRGPTGPWGGTIGPLAPSGGPSILLPAAALLLGTGVLTYTILSRRT
jgi:hypothetical protein